MFKQIWQSLSKSTVKGRKGHPSTKKQGLSTEIVPELNDQDYEFLWLQLLEGVSHGWHSQKLVNFFKILGERGKEELWLSWLNRFEEKLLASSYADQQLGQKMLQFGQKAQDELLLKNIAEKSYQIGRLLVTRQPGSIIWEYEGPDQIFAQEIIAPIPTEIQTTIETENNQVEDQSLSAQPPEIKTEVKTVPDPWQDSPEPEENQPTRVETLTLKELVERLKNDSNLRSQVASQLQVNSDNIRDIITVLGQQMQIPPEELNSLFTQVIDDNNISDQTDQEVTQANEEQGKDRPAEFESLFYEGLAKADQGEMLEAIAYWDQALSLNPNFSAIWHNRGSALGHLGRLEEAIASFDQALKINPQDFQAWNDRGNALYNLKQWEKAIESWDQALTLKSDFVQAWYSRGCALEHLTRFEEAVQSYDQAIALKPDFEMAIARKNKLVS